MTRLKLEFFRLVVFASLALFSVSASAVPDISATRGFVIAGPATMATILNTQASTIPITVTPVGGFTGGVMLQCNTDKSKANYLQAPVCAFSVIQTTLPTVTITSANPVSAQLTVMPEGFALPLTASPTGTTESAKTGAKSSSVLLAKSAMLLSAIVFCLPKRRKSGALLLLLLAATMIPLGCGGSSRMRTPPGTYSYIVSGSDTATNTITSFAEISIQVVS